MIKHIRTILIHLPRYECCRQRITYCVYILCIFDSVRTDEELSQLDEHTIPRLDHFLFDWETPGPSSDWKIRQQLKQSLPTWAASVVDFVFGVGFDGKKMFKLDTDRLAEVRVCDVVQSGRVWGG